MMRQTMDISTQRYRDTESLLSGAERKKISLYLCVSVLENTPYVVPTGKRYDVATGKRYDVSTATPYEAT